MAQRSLHASLAACAFGHGRLARASFLGRLALLGAAGCAFGLLALSLAGDWGAALVAAAFLWGAAGLCVQRLHDAGSSGRWLLLALIPVLGALALLSMLARRGAEGPNAFGPDPSSRLGYLRVDIHADPRA